ncbi:MAG: DUF1259 domain-containing protein [Thermoproteota archaeon]|nr:DUF1259 domain-containing protein [Thermoproteota archaeon]
MMKGKKSLLLLPIGLAFLICSVAIVGSISPTAFGQQQGTTGGNQNTTAQTTGGLDCQMAASTLGGMVIPNPTGTCDVAVPRQGVQVFDAATGAPLNNLLVINPLFEFTQIQNQAAGGTGGNTTAGGTGGNTTAGGNQAMVYGFAEFALMEAELPSAMRTLADTSWNVIAVHNHVIGESPKMIFAHAIANGDINTLARDARIVLDALMQGQAGNQTSTTTGGMAGNATTAGGGTTAGNINSSPSANSLTGGTTTGQGATAGGGVGTFGGGGGSSPDPGVGTTEGGTGGGGATTGGGGATTGGGEASGGTPNNPGGAAGPQVRP